MTNLFILVLGRKGGQSDDKIPYDYLGLREYMKSVGATEVIYGLAWIWAARTKDEAGVAVRDRVVAFLHPMDSLYVGELHGHVLPGRNIDNDAVRLLL